MKQVPLSLLALLLLLLVQKSFSERWVNNQLFDLEDTSLTFMVDANQWTASHLVDNQIYSICKDTYLLGGFKTLGRLDGSFVTGEYFQRDYTSLPSHNLIIVTLTFFKIDSWDLPESDHVEFNFDGISINTWNLPSFVDYEQAVCGIEGYGDNPNIKIIMSVPHTDYSLRLKVISRLTQDTTDESFGFREISMLFTNSLITSASLCGVTSFVLPDRTCPCSSYGQYEQPTGSGSCYPCHADCPLCNGPNSNNCLACNSGKYLNNLNQCVSCSAPCATCQGSSTYCVTCQSGWFMLSAHTCISSCDYPLIQTSSNSITYCSSPCSSNQVIFPDRSCSSACDPLLQETAVGPFKICKVPCASNQVLYYTGACSTTCDLPFSMRSYGSYSVCDYICSGSEYLYPDGTCKEGCNQPFRPTTKGGKRFCEPYCTSTQYFYSPTLTCVTNCPFYYYAEENPKTCQKCKDNLCISCPTANGQRCAQCQEKSILDIVDGSCKVCSIMKIDYLGTIGNNGHQYALRLGPSSCILNVQTLINNLIATEETKALFPSFSIQIKKSTSNLFLLNIIFEGSILKQGDLDFNLSYLKAAAPVPKTLLPDSTVQKLAEYTPTAKALVTSITSVSLGGAFALGAMALLWPMINFQQFIGYFIYINVDYPLQVELFLSLFSLANFNFLPNPLSPLTDELAQEISNVEDPTLLKVYDSPIKFQKQDIKSFFVEDGSSVLLSNLSLLAVLMLTGFIVKFYRRPIPFMRPIHYTLKWNFILRAFLENGIPLTLSTFLQLKRLSFENTYTIICGVLAVISFFYIIAMLRFLISTVTKTTNQTIKLKYVAQQYGTLYEGMSPENSTAKYYHIFLLFRGLLLVFLVVFMEAHPLLQTIPLIIVNFVLLFFLFRQKLFENSTVNIISRIKEILITAAEICIMLLALEYESEDYPQTLGWIIIGFLGIALLIEMIYILNEQFKQIKQRYRKFKFFSQAFIFESYAKWKLKIKKMDRNSTITSNGTNSQSSQLKTLEM